MRRIWHDQMDIHIGGRGGLEGAQELQEFAAAVASVQLANHATSATFKAANSMVVSWRR